MDAGRLLASGTPHDADGEHGDARPGRRLHRALARGAAGAAIARFAIPPRRADDGEPAIEATRLTRRFGDFTAVDHVSFRIERGEIFGFLGSNGCGKTTTMKMLTGLLPATEGHARLFGRAVDPRDLDSRRRVGYMSQGFSLYGELTVRQNLELHARLFQLPASSVASARRRAARPVRPRRPRGRAGRGAARRNPPASVAGRGDGARARDPDPRRADLRRRSGGARPVLGAAHRPLAAATA